MKSLEEYKKEIEQDPKARRRLRKLEKEFEAVEESLTDEELVKYGLKPAEPTGSTEMVGSTEAAGSTETAELTETEAPDEEKASENNATADSVIDLISRKL